MFRFLSSHCPLVVLFCMAGPLAAQEATVPGDVLVMLHPGADPHALAKDLHLPGLTVAGEVSVPMRTWLFRYDPARVPQEAALRAFRGHAGVQLAQANHVIEERAAPNDPLYPQQWWHQNIQSALAWNTTTGGVTASGDTIVVAIIEKADLTHPDLLANAWVNRHEIPGNGIDDDGNGYVDDVRGWDPQALNDEVYSGSHGTRVAGMIGAVGNNGLQVAGVNWHVKMMPVNYANTQEASVLAAYTYPLVMRRLYNSTGGAKGAFVVATNASWGLDGGQPANAPIWCAVYDTLGTAGILNCASTTNSNVDVDVVGDLPTACPSPYMISVTATNANDMRTTAGYGATTIDLGAPGTNVLTTTLDGGTGTSTGTSFASPLTAGVVALLYSVPCPSLSILAHNNPQAAADQVRAALLNGVDQVGNLPGQTVTGGRVNSANSVQLLMDGCAACPPPYGLAIASGAIGSATVEWNAVPGTYWLRYRTVGGTAWNTVAAGGAHSMALADLEVCAPYEFQAGIECGDEVVYGPVVAWTSEGCCTPPLTVAATPVDSTAALVEWSTVLAAESYGLRWRGAGEVEWNDLQDELTGNSMALTGLVPCSDIEVQMGSVCEVNDSEWSASVLMHVPGCGHCLEGTFCSSRGNSTQYEWIGLVQVGDINRSSTSDGGYASVEVTAQTTELRLGQTYPISLAPGYAIFAYSESFTVWLDSNHDGQFTANERLYAGLTNSATQPLQGTITVPANALPGPTRLRVLMKSTEPPASGCGVYNYGETEDYCVTLVDSTMGIGEIPAVPVQLFPQPADQVLHLRLQHPGMLRIVVRDIMGRTVAGEYFTDGALSLPTAAWGAGLYQFSIWEGEKPLARGNFMVVH